MAARITMLPLYNNYFPNPAMTGASGLQRDWTNFKTKEIGTTTSLSTRDVDFAIRDTTWVDGAKHILSIFRNVIFLSYFLNFLTEYRIQRLIGPILRALQDHTLSKILTQRTMDHSVLALKVLLPVHIGYTTLRYVIQRFIMLNLYFAQSRIMKKIDPFNLGIPTLNNRIAATAKELDLKGYIIRDVVLMHNGVKFSGLLAGHKELINNGRWVLQATGNYAPIESVARDSACAYASLSFNTLLINGPSVGRSEGHATPKSMGDAQEVGLLFIEKALKAKNIVIAGDSLGGAAIGQAILKHAFKENIRYLVIRRITFDKVSNISAAIVGTVFPKLKGLVAKIIQWAGCEIDSVASSRKLQKLGIKEVIMQAVCKDLPEHEDLKSEHFVFDGVIPSEASLGRALIQENIVADKIFLRMPGAEHTIGAASLILLCKEEVLEEMPLPAASP